MMYLNKIAIIAYYTFREIIKSRVLLNTLILGLVLLFTTYVALSFTYGSPERVTLDFGMGMLSLSSVGIAIFMGVGLLSKEIESRTAYMIISRPVKRSAFILGKLLGLGSILTLNIFILSSFTLFLYFFVGGEFQPLILWTILFTILESLLVLFIVALFSLLSGQAISVIMTIGLYVSGHAIHSAKEALADKSIVLNTLLEAYHYILPGFYKLNIKDFLLYQKELPYMYLLNIFTYGVIYSVALILLSVIIFERKNLD